MSTRTALVLAILAAGENCPVSIAAQSPTAITSIGPTLDEARKALTAAEATAAKFGVAVSCAVVDARGDLVALHRMDKARFITVDIARGKALAAAIFGRPSGSALTKLRIPAVVPEPEHCRAGASVSCPGWAADHPEQRDVRGGRMQRRFQQTGRRLRQSRRVDVLGPPMIATLEPVQRRLVGLIIAAAVFVSPRLLTGQANRVRLTFADAQASIAAAQRSAAAMDVRVSIAVVDPRGDLIAIERMTGANPAEC